MNKNKVSCITITRNRVHFLRKCIEYYTNQTYSDKELIIVGFDDDVDTYDYIKKIDTNNFLEEHNIKFYQIEPNTILGNARNIAIEKATGSWVCIWDDDDYFSPDRIKEQLKYCKENGVEGTLLSCLMIFSERHQEVRVSFERETGWEGTLFIKKSKILEYEDLEKGEDTPMIEKLFENVNISVMFNSDLYLYYLHSKNTSGFRHIQNIYDYSLSLNNQKNREIKKLIGIL